MPKRFIDSGLFKKKWFRALSGDYKTLFIYLFTDCDCAGIWEVDFELAEIYCGNVTQAEAEKLFINHIIRLDENKKWFLIDFVPFQYGDKLNEKSPVHKKVIDILKKYKVGKDTLFTTLFNRLSDRVSNTPKEEEEVKEEVKGGVGEMKIPESPFQLSTALQLPAHVMEAAEYNQFSQTKDKNTEWIKDQWKIFLAERTNDHPGKKVQYRTIGDLTNYFLNWIRNKFPKQQFQRSNENTRSGPPLKTL